VVEFVVVLVQVRLWQVKAKNTDEYDLAEIANHPAFASSLKFD
jgi:hypothetical protein